MPKLSRTTFTLTETQIRQINEMSEKTGLLKSEIVRRFLDKGFEDEEAKEERKFFTPEQRREIKEISRAKGISELDVVRRAINREINRFFRRY